MKDKTMKKFQKCILEVAKLAYPTIRKRKYQLSYYLDAFLMVKSHCATWKALRRDSHNYKTHWKSIYNEFDKWSKDDIFNVAFNNFVKNNYFKLNKARYCKRISFFIDVTKITNLRGKEHIVINSEYMKKRITPLSVMCDENKLPVALCVIPINKTLVNGVKTAKHDVSCIQETLDTIPFEIPSYIKVSITGDKGYITRKKFQIKNHVLSITAPKRRNQKIKTSKKDKKKLKERYKIENLFAILKTNPQVFVRCHSKLKNYCSFVYLAMLERYFMFIETNKPELLDKI
jgi:hypothetical protein